MTINEQVEQIEKDVLNAWYKRWTGKTFDETVQEIVNRCYLEQKYKNVES